MKFIPKWQKIVAYFFLFFAFFFIFQNIYHQSTGDFRLSNIRYEETSFRPKTLNSSENLTELDKIKTILSQPYQFLGMGNQSYAFLSEDSKYVLKFFKFGHLKKNWILNLLPEVPFITRYLDGKNRSQEKRFLKVFEGYQIAYQEDPENTGVLFIHLNKTVNLLQSVTVKDKIGFEHIIDLDDVVFVIQEKVTPTKDVITDLLKKGDIDGAKVRVSQLFDLYLSQYKKGIYDRDHNLMVNTGFKENMAIRLDVGKLKKNNEVKNPIFQKKDLQKIAFKRIDRFIKSGFPAYQKEMLTYMDTQLKNTFDDEKNNEK